MDMINGWFKDRTPYGDREDATGIRQFHAGFEAIEQPLKAFTTPENTASYLASRLWQLHSRLEVEYYSLFEALNDEASLAQDRVPATVRHTAWQERLEALRRAIARLKKPEAAGAAEEMALNLWDHQLDASSSVDAAILQQCSRARQWWISTSEARRCEWFEEEVITPLRNRRKLPPGMAKADYAIELAASRILCKLKRLENAERAVREKRRELESYRARTSADMYENRCRAALEPLLIEATRSFYDRKPETTGQRSRKSPASLRGTLSLLSLAVPAITLIAALARGAEQAIA